MCSKYIHYFINKSTDANIKSQNFDTNFLFFGSVTTASTAVTVKPIRRLFFINKIDKQNKNSNVKRLTGK